MKHSRVLAVVLFVVSLLGASAAGAQATRTWVSGVGDDANPCSRTAPCKTFAGAISKTATNGEINVLDPGAFGAVTITKSITISSEGFEAGVLATLGSSGIVINAPSTAVVVLRGLDIEGAASGANGIRFLAGGVLHVEDCTINRFTTNGIDFNPSGAAFLEVRNTIIRNHNGATSAGIRVRSSVNGVLATAQLDNVRLDRNSIGLLVENTAKVTVSNSVIANNTIHGINANAAVAGFLPFVTLDSSQHSGNDTAFRVANGAVVTISDATISLNNVAFNISGGGLVVSLGNNAIVSNNSGEPPIGGFSTIALE